MPVHSKWSQKLHLSHAIPSSTTNSEHIGQISVEGLDMDESNKADFGEPEEMSKTCGDDEGDIARQHVVDVPTVSCLDFPFRMDEEEFPKF